MAKSLAERIQSSLQPSARLADIRTTLADAEAEKPKLESQQQSAESQAEAPDTSAKEARTAREQAEDLAFEIRRLDRAIERLREAIDRKLADESYAQRRQEYDAGEAERDQLVSELREEGAAALKTVARLAAAVQASDRRIAAINRELPQDREKLISAELIARGALNTEFWPNAIGENGEHFERITRLKIPRFDEPGLLWPPADGVREAANAMSYVPAQGREKASA